MIELVFVLVVIIFCLCIGLACAYVVSRPLLRSFLQPACRPLGSMLAMMGALVILGTVLLFLHFGRSPSLEPLMRAYFNAFPSSLGGAVLSYALMVLACAVVGVLVGVALAKLLCRHAEGASPEPREMG